MIGMDYSGKVVSITGAGGAIGRAMALAFAENGAQVAVLERNEASGCETVRLIEAAGGTARFVSADVTDRAQIAGAIAELAEAMGGLDVFINNAGINVGPDQRFPIHQFSDDWWDAIIRVDLDGVYHCSKAAVPRMTAGGVILNVSSVVGAVPFRRQCAFAAAKAGVINLSKAMALELAELNIRVNALLPGTVAMPGTKALWSSDNAMNALLSHIPQHRQGEPRDIANAALFLCSDLAGYVTGAALNVDGGWLCGYARDF